MALPEELYQLRAKLDQHRSLNEELRHVSEAAERIQAKGSRQRWTPEEEEELGLAARRAEELVTVIGELSEELADTSDVLWALHEALMEHEENEERMEDVERRHVELFSHVHCEADVTPQLREREAQLIDELAELEPHVNHSYQQVMDLLEEFAAEMREGSHTMES